MMGTSPENAYLEQVLQQQAQVDQELRRVPAAAQMQLQRARAPTPAPAPGGSAPAAVNFLKRSLKGDEAAEPLRAIDHRITGFWLWKTVVVPPNVYVVHTRRGRTEPVTIGLGISFRFNSYHDAFLLIPAAMQTIIINARCICIDRQGILVQAYVQWIIDDIRTAYRKLDFSAPEDPMRIVNVQLREQAEAAIKDKVATMGIDDVLSDKQPIIAELTHRLREVAEGSRQENDAGLGLKIVTVQIKEAVVSSTRLWENLQKPFRAEREKIARMAELESQQQIAARELEYRQTRETAELETSSRLAQLRAAKEQEFYDREQAEKVRRHQLEQQSEQRALIERNETEKVRKQADLDLALKELELEARRIESAIESVRRQMQWDEATAERKRGQATADLGVEELRSQAEAVRSERELAIRKTRQQIENDLSESHLRAQLIARLPEIAQALPKPQELRAVTVSSDGDGSATALVGFLASVLHLARDALKRPENAEKEKGSP
jgi:hypothetical protein